MCIIFKSKGMDIKMDYSIKGVVKKSKLLNTKYKKYMKLFSIAFVTVLTSAIIALLIIGLGFGVGLFKGIIDDAPDLSTLDVLPKGYTTLVYDSEGIEIAKLISPDTNRRYRTMDQIPVDLQNAFVSIEDERFYSHNGIDITGILRAAYSTFQSASLGQGASTITQQVLKNNVFDDWTNEKTGQKIKRKLQEQLLAIELEKQMLEEHGEAGGKEKILEIYLNTINLGQGTLGVEAASRRYFNKSAYELTLSECATIAGITKNPSAYNPIYYPEQNKVRRDKILNNMLEQGYITQSEYNVAYSDDVYARIKSINEEMANSNIYSYFVDELVAQVLEDLETELGYNDTQAYNALFGGGLSIYTTQDSEIQSIADDAYSNPENYPTENKWSLNYALTIEKSDGELENHSSEMFKAFIKEESPKFNMIYKDPENATIDIEAYKLAVMKTGDKIRAESIVLTPQPQISFSIIDHHTGHILALVGGRGEKTASRTLNRATSTTRPPGSTFKILAAYGPAFDSAGVTLADVYNDAPFNYLDGIPVLNFDDEYHGVLSTRYAITKSYNIPAVKVITEISPQLAYDYVTNFGFTTIIASKEVNGQIHSDIGQPLALGGLAEGVTNLELTAAYASIANNGTYIKPTLYTKIIDSEGNVLLDKSEQTTKKVIKESTAFLLTSAMKDVMTSGTGTKANFRGMQIAGKTGTSSEDYDAWFVGFTPYYTAGAWTGYDNNVNMSDSEKNTSKLMWKKIMEQIHEGLESKPFNKPSDIAVCTICTKSGKLPIPGLCDATLGTEYFTDGTQPTEMCNVHYQGTYCTYSGLPANELCPFKAEGVLELVPPENIPGTVITVLDPTTGLPTTTTIPNTGANIDPVTGEEIVVSSGITYCPHDAAFFSQPNYEALINQQRAEMEQRALADQQAALAALAAQQAAAGQ